MLTLIRTHRWHYVRFQISKVAISKNDTNENTYMGLCKISISSIAISNGNTNKYTWMGLCKILNIQGRNF